MNTFSHPRFRTGWILLILGIISSFFWTLYRWNFENNYTKTQITLDIEDTKSLADAYGISQAQILKDFHDKGARSLAIYDQSISTLRDNGRIAILPRETVEASFPPEVWIKTDPKYRYLITSSDDKLLEQIKPRLREQSTQGFEEVNYTRPRYPEYELSARLSTTENSRVLPKRAFWIPASKQLFNDVAVGFDPDQIAFAKKYGYSITARISNPLNLTPKVLDELIKDIKGTGAKVVIFSEDEVLGYDTLISNAARLMRNNGLIFSNIEFSKQRGAADFAKNTEGQLVRVHSVQGDEASRTEPEMMVDRFVRAAKERNMRVLYVRLLRQQKGEPKEPVNSLSPIELEKSAYIQNLEFIGKVSDGITESQPIVNLLRPPLQLENAEPFGDYPNQQFTAFAGHKGSKALRFLMLFGAGLGVVGATLLVLNLFYDWSDAGRRNWLILGLLMVAGFSLSAGMGAKVMSLVGGSFVSIVAVMWGGLPLVWDGISKPDKNATPSQIAWFAFKMLAKTTLITLAGALLVVALLNNWRYMSKADEFLGEKATQFIPLLLLPLAFLGEIFPHRVIQNGAAQSRALAWRRVSNALDRPFTAKIALVSLLVMGVGYVWMARFGNESGMTISSFELALRANLEKIFITRPRTKEIFMGMPAFMLAIALVPRNYKLLTLGAVTVAVIGQTDVLNSMCHIHTPVFYCIWRSLMGILIGGTIGAVALIFFEKVVAPRIPNFNSRQVS